MDEPFRLAGRAYRPATPALAAERLARRQRPTVIFVTHDLREATLLADRILFLSTSPARIVAEVQVGIPRAERQNLSLVEHRYTEIRSRFEAVYG